MPRPTKFSVAHKKVIKSLNKENKQFFTLRDIASIFYEKKDVWGLATSMNLDDFIGNLVENDDLKVIKLEFPQKTVLNYFMGIGNIPINTLVLSIKENAYLSHYTALQYHSLTEQIPKTIYVTSERKNKKPTSIVKENSLTQESISIAFSKEQRVSNNCAIFNDYTICLLEGMTTNNKGVIEIKNNDGSIIRVTDIERTLIDIVVRPNYSGGISEVLKAYEKAADKVSVNRISAYLSHMKFIYPYAQAIGFYMEQSGAYTDKQISLLHKEFSLDFYLTYSMKDVEYSKKWKVYYPKYF